MKLVNIYEDGSGLLHFVEKRERNTINASTGPSVGIRSHILRSVVAFLSVVQQVMYVGLFCSECVYK